MLRVDTWKQTLDGELTRHWSNTYYMQQDLLLGWQGTYDGGDQMRSFLRNESDLCMDVVSYKQVTAFPIDGDITDGMIMWTFEGTLRGFWDHPSGMVPFDTVRRHSFSALYGRPRQLYIRCGLENSDITMTESGHLKLLHWNKWENAFQAAVAGWFAVIPQNWFYLRRDIFRPLTVAWLNPVKWQLRGASELHAIERAYRRETGGGAAMFEAALDTTYQIAAYRRDWWLGRDLHLSEWPVYSYWQPLLNLLGTTIALLQQVSDFFAASGGGGNGQGHIARWPPLSADISDIALTVKANMESHRDAVSRIVWNGDGSGRWCDEDDATKFKQASLDLSKQLAWLPSCDFRTPLTDTTV